MSPYRTAALPPVSLPRITRMAKWTSDAVTLEWVIGIPYVEMKTWDGKGAPQQTVRLHVDAARELAVALGVALREAAESESEERKEGT